MPPTKPKGGKLMSLINYRLRITLDDARQIVGQLLAFDNHMNLVLSDAQEYRRVKSKKAAAAARAEEEEQGLPPASIAPEQKRTLGMIILRGENIVSMSIEAPPPAEHRNEPAMLPGPGRGAPIGRGIPLATPPTAAGGAPPMMAGRPMPYARPPPSGPPPAMGMGMGMGMGIPAGPPPGFPRPPGFAPPGMPAGPPPGFAAPPGAGAGAGAGGFPPRPPPG